MTKSDEIDASWAAVSDKTICALVTANKIAAHSICTGMLTPAQIIIIIIAMTMFMVLSS